MHGVLRWQLEYRGTGQLAPAYQRHAHGAALVVHRRLDPDVPPIAEDRAITREVALSWRRAAFPLYA
jgi:hypothetical protein